MALEVGRITARIDAAVDDFDQKMSGAQKKFQDVSVKMEESGRAATAALRKTYTERILAANHTAAVEIEAARRTMIERLRFASSTSEISALRKVYSERAAAARAGAAAEVQAAQQAFISGSKGIAPIASTLDAVAKASGRAAPGINSVRSAMTALTASALQTAPGVAQVSSVLSAMALGAPLTIAVLAGIVAITFAWEKLTASSKELKKAVEESDAAIAALGATEATNLVKLQGAQNQRITEIDGLIADFRKMSLVRDLIPPELQKYNDLLAERARRLSKVADLEGRITAFHKTELDKQIKDQQDALDKEKRAFEKFADEIIRQWQRLQIKITPFELRNRVRMQLGGEVSLGNRERQQQLPPELLNAFLTGASAAARGAGGGTAGPGAAPKVGKSILDVLKGKLDPKTILSSLASGGISTAIGVGISALSKLGDSIFDFSGKAKAAAAAMKKAQEEWSKSLDRFILQNTGTTAQKNMADAIDQVEGFIAGFEEAFNKGNKLKRPNFTSLDELLTWAQELLATSLSVDPARAKEWQKIIDAIKILQTELGKTADAANETVASLTNVPNGFKIALARFNATIGQPVLPPFIGTPPRGGFNPVAPNAAMNARTTTYVFEGGIHVEAKDPVDFLEKLEVEIQRKKLRGAPTITLDYTT